MIGSLHTPRFARITMYYNDNENMDEDQYGEDSQQATQGSSQEDGGVTSGHPSSR